jgi:acetyl esterase/lipase
MYLRRMSSDASPLVERLEPDLAGQVRQLAVPDMSDEFLEVMRQMPLPPFTSDAVDRSEHLVPGDPPVPVRVHRPKDVSGPLPAYVSMHGGGYISGTYDMDDAKFNRVCPAIGMVGMSIDYRLAPDTPYPGPLEDCYRALLWTFEHAAEIGIAPGRIGIGGISAGGGLAAALGLLVRDRGEVELRFQVLESPMIDDRQQTASSQLDGLPIWSRASNAYGWRAYLGQLHGAEDVPATASPARAQDLSGLPATIVVVGALDGFLDENVDYAMRLHRAGVPTELHVHPGACHGYQLFEDCDVTKRSNRGVDEWVARQIAQPTPSA